MIKFLIFEYITAAAFLLVFYNYKNVKSVEKLENIVAEQQITIASLVDIINSNSSKNEVVEKHVEYTTKTEKTYKNKGTFRITAYCSCAKCCGKWASLNGGGYTASGTKVKEGRTIAVYKDQIPFGTEVKIEGLGTYIAEDTGSAIKENCIDVYFDSHEEALNFGVKYLNVEY